ncbi:MAG: hypothetical protein KGL39_52520 [Patescibacteria group bacterium]|nr:hypothetical protein [Patescibacteria group bacterium]
MKTFYHKSFTGHYPIGVSAIIVAENAKEATELLNLTLKQDHALNGDAAEGDLVEVDTTRQQAIVIGDGNY